MKIKYSSIIKILIWIHFIMWLLLIPVTEFQLLLFGKKIITLYVLGIVEFIVFTLFIIILAAKKKIHLNSICKIFAGYIIVMMTLWVIGFAVNVNTPIYWKLYYIFYWIMPALIVIVASQVRFNFKPMIKVVTLVAFINAVIVLIQHYGNTLLWPFEFDDQGKTLFFISSSYYNTNEMVRCPGLCMSGLDSGALMIFGMLFIFADENQKLFKKIVSIGFLVFATWFTGTRNIYFFFLFVVGCIFINYVLKKKEHVKKKITILYTLLALAFSMFLQMGLGVVKQNATQNLLTDFTSMNIRLGVWETVINDFNSGNFFQKLIGRSVWQSAGYSKVMDNMYLELLIMVGIIGLIAFCIFILKLSLEAMNKKSKSIIPYYSYLLGLFVYGTLNVIGSLNLTFLMLIGIFISQYDEAEKTIT